MNRIEAAKDLLKRIEAVDHTDDAALDEIDARVSVETHSYLKGDYVFKEIEDGHLALYINSKGLKCRLYLSDIPKCTRSRDALKSARPDGCIYHMVTEKEGVLRCILIKGSVTYRVDSAHLPTEELAELHAIIQAWIYIWKNEC